MKPSTRVTTMHHAKAIKYAFASFVLVLSVACGLLLTVQGQETNVTEPAAKKSESTAQKPVRSGRDPFVPYRHETVWTDGRHEKTVEMKALRPQSPVDAMAAVKSAPASPAPEAEKKSEQKVSATNKP